MRVSMSHLGAVVVVVAVMMAGCENKTSASAKDALQVQRSIDQTQLVRGKALFEQNCARCHGEMAQGDPHWRVMNSDGTFPPPPLDSTGHAWHHSHAWLHEVIITGTEPQGHMPAWGGRLNDQQVDDIIAWFQSLWSNEVYAAWREMEQRHHTVN